MRQFHCCRQTKGLSGRHPGGLEPRERTTDECERAKSVRDTVIVCTHKIAAVCSSNDLRSSESSEMAPARLPECICATAQSQETATRLINKKAKDLSEQRRWHFTERNTCTISSTGSFSCISFPLHQSHRCACTASAWLNSGCELFILFKSMGANTDFFLSYTSCTYCKCAPHQIWPEYMCSWSQRT